jgi:ADP-ribosyl-[dinitrogen reductase] hydrolase
MKNILFGVAIGDALGVPVEFNSRQSLKNYPIVDMIGFGSHNQPAGTWSDDSSLTFCLAESLCNGFNLNDLGNKFVQWYRDNYWTAHDEVFDIGNATQVAIVKLKQGVSPITAGGRDETSNGNGSLMRILPLAPFITDMPIEKRFEMVSQVSSLTHAHTRSILSCFFYIEFAIQLLKKLDKMEAFAKAQEIVNQFLTQNTICSEKEMQLLHRILKNTGSEWQTFKEDEIGSSGYVIHSLEASIWCLLSTEDYKSAVCKAVNLGEDTDTTGAITGGLAGIYYGFDQIPVDWINKLAKKDDIMNLAERCMNIETL